MQQVVELNGYVIIVVEGRDNKIKLYGSPADKDNLEVADEILDVNERKLEDLPRAEVIRYIHEVRFVVHLIVIGSSLIRSEPIEIRIAVTNQRVFFSFSFFFIVSLLLQCIQSCVIKLRVKRRSDSRLGKFLF